MTVDSLSARTYQMYRGRGGEVQGYRRSKIRMGRVLIAVFSLLFLCSYLSLHAQTMMLEGGQRVVAERLTRAIAQRDTASIRQLFVAGVGDEVVKDLRMGALAGRLHAMGGLRNVRIMRVGKGNMPWKLVASFTHGTQFELVRFQGNRIAAFTLRSPQVAAR